jgi:hypothetical protein
MTNLSTKVTLLFLCSAVPSLTQTKPPIPSVEQKSERSTCVNIVALTGNVNLNCSSLTPAQSKSILEIQTMIRKMVANQVDPSVIDQMNLKLDEILNRPTGQGSLIQSNSGGVNIQQGSTGAGSPIVNSPISVGLYPPRHVSSDWIAQGIPYLSVYPAKALVLYPSTDGDAFTYAKEIADLLRTAGWTVDGPNGAMIVSNGGPEYGISITYKGEKTAPGQQVKLVTDSSSGRLLNFLLALQNKSDVYADPEPGVDEGHMTVTVNGNPKSRPQ